MKKNKHTNVYLDIIYQHRNKAYGSYAFRKNAKKWTILACLFSMLLIGIPIAIYFFNIRSSNEDFDQIPLPDIKQEIDLGLPPPVFEATKKEKLDTKTTITKAVQPKPKPTVVKPKDPNKDKPLVLVKDDKANQVPDKTADPNIIAGNDLDKSQNDTQNQSQNTANNDQNANNGNDATNVGSKTDKKGIQIEIDQPAKCNYNYIRYLITDLKYPFDALDAGITGVILMEFRVNIDGTISHVRVLQGAEIGHGLPEEAIRLVTYAPRWIAARRRGVAIPSYVAVPVYFTIRK